VATVTGFTAERMLEIENSTVVSGEIDVDGHLILLTRDGTPIDAGSALPALPTASTTVSGIVELATVLEATTGTDTTRAVTPEGLAAAITAAAVPDASDTVKGKVELATDAEAIAGTSTTLAVTPHGLAATVSAATAPDATTTLKGVVELATNGEVITGTDAVRAVTPASLDLAITTGKIAANAVTTGKLATSAVTATELASNAVTTAKILDANVTNAKLADMTASTFKGRISSTGAPQDLSVSEVLTALGITPTTSYTPAFTATTTNPTLGTTTRTGRYTIVGNLCIVQIEIVIGSGFSAGSGGYRFGLPAGITNVGGGAPGSAMIVDASPFTVWVGFCSVFSTEVEIYRAIDTGTTTVPVGSGSISWAAGDLIRLTAIFPI
jgi:hypothetical protein